MLMWSRKVLESSFYPGNQAVKASGITMLGTLFLDNIAMEFVLHESLWCHMKSCCLKLAMNQPEVNYLRNSTLILSDNIDEMFDHLPHTKKNSRMPKFQQMMELYMSSLSLLEKLRIQEEQHWGDSYCILAQTIPRPDLETASRLNSNTYQCESNTTAKVIL